MKSKHTAALVSLLGALALMAPVAHAYDNDNCTNQYGTSIECPTNKVVVNKKVRYPTNTNLFVENLTSNDTAYSPNSEVEYDIAVTNTSTTDYATVTVIDYFPSQVVFVSGPGRYEASSNKLTYEISNLKAGQTVHDRVLVKVKDISVFPQDLTCEVTNKVTVTAPENQSDEDTANLCVQTKVLGVSTLPVAGFEDYAYMIPFIGLAIIGSGILAKGAFRP